MPLFIRTFDEPLKKQAKAAAAIAGMTLADWVEQACRNALQPVVGHSRASQAGYPALRAPITHGPKGTCKAYLCPQCVAAGKIYS